MKGVVLACVAVALTVSVSAAAVDEEAREVLADERYRFCHEPQYPLFVEERAWCELVGEKSEVCPELPAACAAGIEPELERGEWRLSRGEERRAEPPEGDDRQAEREKREFTMPAVFGSIAQLLFWALVGAGLVALVWVIVKNLRRGDDAEPGLDAPEADEPDAETSAAARVVETDVERLLARARAAAASGDYEQAIEAAYAAALRRLEGDALIDMHESRTNGDYVRALRNRPDLATALRDIVREVERVQFGAQAASASLFEAIMARVVPLATRGAALVLVVCCMLAGACTPSQGDGGGGSPAARGGTSPSGTRGVVELLKKDGIDAGYRLEPLGRADDEVGVIVVLPGGGPEPDEWKPLLEWVREGGLLILAGELPPTGDLPLEQVMDPPTATAVLQPGGDHYYHLDGLEARVPSDVALRIPPDAAGAVEPLLSRDPWQLDGPHYAVAEKMGDGEIMVFADERLFTNIALAVGDNAELLTRLLSYQGPVELSDPWTAAGADNPLESMHNAHLTPLVLQLLLLLVLFVLWKGSAFGTPRDDEQRTRRSFSEHVRAVGMQYARAGAASHALGVYAAWALERLRERLPKGRQRSLDELAAEVAARTGRDRGEVARLLYEAQAASDRTAPASYRPDSLRAGAPAPLASPGDRVALLDRLAELLGALGRR